MFNRTVAYENNSPAFLYQNLITASARSRVYITFSLMLNKQTRVCRDETHIDTSRKIYVYNQYYIMILLINNINFLY